MPLMDGYDTAKQLRENSVTQNIPIIAISGEASPRDRHMSDFCNTVIQKPFNLIDLMDIIKTYLGAVD
jgi:CheY-like chemotaxis protein